MMSSSSTSTTAAGESPAPSQGAHHNQPPLAPTSDSLSDNLFIGNNIERIKTTSLKGPLLSMNTNGANLHQAQGITELFHFAYAKKAKIICGQDHRLHKNNKHKLEKKARWEWANGEMPLTHFSYGNVVGNKSANNKKTQKRRIGGTFVAIHPSLAPQVVGQMADNKLGRWSGLVLQGKNESNGKRNTVAVISIYFPTQSNKPDSMWQYQKRQIGGTNPRFAALRDLKQACLDAKKKYGCKFIITGDWNFDLTRPSTSAARANKIFKELEIINNQNTWFDKKPVSYIQSMKNEKNRSWIDHTLISEALTDKGAIEGCGVATPANRITNSDHRLSFTAINFGLMLNLESLSAATHPAAPRKLKCTDEKLESEFNKIVRNTPGVGKLIKEVNQVFKKAKKHRRERSTKKEIQKKGAKLLARVVKIWIDAESALSNKIPTMSRTKKGGYSHWFIHKRERLRKTVTFFRHAKRLKSNTKITSMAKKLNNTYGVKLQLSSIPLSNRTESWKEWLKNSSKTCKTMCAELDSRHRQRNREKGTKHAKKMEQHRLISREKGIYYRDIKAHKRVSAPPLAIGTKDENGNMQIHIGAEALIAAENAYLPIHLGGKVNPYYRVTDKNHPFLSPLKASRTRRKRFQRGSNEDLVGIPQRFAPIFEAAKRINDSQTDKPVKSSIYGDIFETEIEEQLFEDIINGKPKNKAPGINGIRIDHLVASPKKLREAVRKLLSLPYLSGIRYNEWRHEMIAWLPKEKGNPDIAKRRPIALLDVMKKICFGAKKKQFITTAMDHGLIHPEHYGALHDRSTVEPILKKIMTLEDALQSNKKLVTADVDLRRAFDMVPHWAKEMALRRIGMPEEGIQLWSSFDQIKLTRSITAYGHSDTVNPIAGSFGQGAEESPLGFVAFMSWMSDYLDTLKLDHYKLQHADNDGLSQSFFVDDSTFAQASTNGMQVLLDGVCTFCHATCMEINFEKSFWTIVNPDKNEENLTLWDWKREPNDEFETGIVVRRPMQLKSNRAIWKYLGHKTNNFGDSKTMLKETLEEDVEPQIEYMRSKRMTGGGVIETSKMLIDSVILYRTQFATINESALSKLQTFIRTFMKQKLHVCRSTPDAIVHGSTEGAGLGINKLWDETNKRKYQHMLAGLNATTVIKQCMLNAVRHAQIASGSSRPFWEHPRPPSYNKWISSLWDWMHEHNIGISLTGIIEPVIRKPIYQNDKNLVDLLYQSREKLEAALKEHPNNQDRLRKLISNVDNFIYRTIKQKKVMISDTTTKALSHGTINLLVKLGIERSQLQPLGKKYYVGKYLCRGQHVTNEEDEIFEVLDHSDHLCLARQIGVVQRRRHRNKVALQTHGISTLHNVHDMTLVQIERIGQRVANVQSDLEWIEQWNICNDKDAGKNEQDTEVHAAMLGIDQRTLKSMPHLNIDIGGSDGSLVGDACSYGWTAGNLDSRAARHDHAAIFAPAAEGSGRLQTSSATSSSTRAEAHGILCGAILASYTQSDLTWYCDSKAAIQTYRKLDKLTESQWLQLGNTDIWRAVLPFKEKNGPHFRLRWVRAHVDDKKKEHFLPPESRKPEHWINIACGALAAEGRSKKPIGSDYWGRPPASATYKGEIFSDGLKALSEEIKWTRIAAEIAERSDIWGPIHKLSLSEMRRQHKRKEVAQMVWLMKLRWRLLATNHVKMIRGQVHPSKNRCPECGTIGDTNVHLLYECESTFAKEAKAKLLEKLGKIMADEAVEQEEREAILRFWNKPMAFEGDEIDMAAKLLEIVNDGADPHAFFYSTSIDQIFEELHLGRRVKKIKKLMSDALSEHQHDIYTQRAKRERKTHTEYVAGHTGARNSAGQANFITIDTLGTLRTRAHSSLKSAARAPARRRGGQRRREPSLTTKTPAMRWEAQYHSTYDGSSSQSDSEGATSSSGTDTGDGLTSDSDSADHSPSDRNIISDTGD